MLLAGDGLVVFLPNRTSLVLPLSLHNMGEYMDMYLLLSRAVIRGAIQNFCAISKGELHTKRSFDKIEKTNLGDKATSIRVKGICDKLMTAATVEQGTNTMQPIELRERFDPIELQRSNTILQAISFCNQDLIKLA